MDDLWSVAWTYLTSERAMAFLRAVIKVGAGVVLARLVSTGLVRLLNEQTDANQAMLLRRVSYYIIIGLFLASALMELGFDLSVLLGAAGILTVAIGFASQTSASNLISGLFLLAERPFVIGDVIRIGDAGAGETTGVVLSIDLLSAKLRTFDNLFVRVPNETLVKSQITNLSRFPIRRVDLQIGVAYKEDAEHVRTVLQEVARRNPQCLEEPEPVLIFQGFGESALNFQFSVWTKRENFLALKTAIQMEIKKAFDEAGIEIPFPHRTLYVGSVTDPFPVRLTNAAQQPNGEPANS